MLSTETSSQVIDDAKNILIGAGAGLSAAAGLLYTDLKTFQVMFPGYADRYGLSCIYQAAFFDFPTLEEHYTYWARHIKKIRLYYPVGEAYHNLLNRIKRKNYFVLTTK